MAGHDIVVIGGSAGGLKALIKICAGLPAGFPASVFVVLHRRRGTPSILPKLLDGAGPLLGREAVDGAAISRGVISVAPPDHHLLLRPGHMLLRRGPYENRTRPAIDPLFRSAAIAYRARVVGVVLSGTLDDGSAGLNAVTACGGICVVQQPDDADWPEMPSNALRQDHVDHCVTAAEMPDLLCRLVQESPGPMPSIPQTLILENRIAMQEVITPDEATVGRPSRLTCPQCGGVLNAIPEPAAPRFRCQIGHAFSADALLSAQDDEIERALDTALRMHRERIVLFRRLQEKAKGGGLRLTAAHWRERSEQSERAAASLADALRALRTSAGKTRKEIP